MSLDESSLSPPFMEFHDRECKRHDEDLQGGTAHPSFMSLLYFVSFFCPGFMRKFPTLIPADLNLHLLTFFLQPRLIFVFWRLRLKMRWERTRRGLVVSFLLFFPFSFMILTPFEWLSLTLFLPPKAAQSFPPPAPMMAPAPVLAAPAPPSLPVTGSLPLPLPASLPVFGSLPVTGTLPVYAPAPALLPPPVAPTAQGTGQNVPVPAATTRQRRVVDMADPYCCHLCFAVFINANGVRSHLTGSTTGGGHGWTRAQLTSDPAGRAPNTLSHFSSQGVDTRYTGNNPKQRNNRRRMEQGLTSTSQSYWDDVYGRSGN